MNPDSYQPTIRTTVHRRAKRATYDRATVHAILDEGFWASVAVSIDGVPHVQPMLYARDGESLILHGSAKNRLLIHARGGGELCVNVTLIDGLILGSTIPDHSMNYRSVSIYSQASEITDIEAKLSAMKRVFDSLIARRWHGLPPLDQEYLAKHTIVFTLPISECVAKINAETPACSSPDIWCGILPFSLAVGDPTPHPDCRQAPPLSISRYRRPQAATHD